jgi:hypothetical protein
MPHDVFISHSSKDKAAADAACAALEAQGIRCWMAARDILPSADWGASIVRAISEAKVFVLIFSQHANTSPYILREVERAVSHGVPIIPLRIEEIAPEASLGYFLGAQHWLDAYTPPLEQHLGYLAEVVRRVIDNGAGSPAPPDRPVPPVRASAPAGLDVPAPARLAVRRRWWSLGVAAGAAVIAVAAAASFVLMRPAQPAAAAVDPKCLVVAPSLADPTACRALLEQGPAWEGCAASYADGDVAAQLKQARRMIAGGRTGSDLYEAAPEFREYAAVSHYWEMVGLCVANGHADFADLSGATSFPTHYWIATRDLRREFGANWSGRGQALPDFLSNLQALCQRYKGQRDKLSAGGGRSLDCTF